MLDLDFPDLDGLALLNHLKADARTAGIAVILLSTRPTDPDVFVTWESGADLLLARPVVVQEVIHFVLMLLRD